MNILRPFTEKSVPLATLTALALSLNACSDVAIERPKNQAITTIAGDINGRIGDSANSETANSADAQSQGPEVTPDANNEPDLPSAPDAIDAADIPTVTDDAAQADVALDVESKPEVMPAEDDTDEPDAIDAADIPTVTDDAAQADESTSDVLPAVDATNTADVSAAKAGICADNIQDQCLQQFKQAMCVDACAKTDKQVEAEMQVKIDELIGDFDKMLSGLSKLPKSAIALGKDYQIIDGNVTWNLTIKNAIADNFHIAYKLEKSEDGVFQTLGWLVTNAGLVPEQFNLQTFTVKPCTTNDYKTVDVTSGNQPSVKVYNGVDISDVAEAEEECKTLKYTKPETQAACSSPYTLLTTTNNYCDPVKDTYTGKPVEFFNTNWEQSNSANIPEYKAFLAKTFAQVQGMLQKHGMDITN